MKRRSLSVVSKIGKKRVLSFLLAMVVVISGLVPVEVSADTVREEELVTVNGVVYRVYEGGCGVWGYHEEELPEDVVIESELEVRPVNFINNSVFYDCTTIQSVELPDSIKRINSCAFSGCTNLTDINLPDGLIYLGGEAFACTALKNVVIPDSVQETEANIFYGCSKLQSVVYPECQKGFDKKSFWGCTSLTSITMPKGIKDIGSNAFASCTKLKHVYYGGSKESWERIEIAEGNECLTSAKIHYALKIAPGDTLTSGKNNYEVTVPGSKGTTGTAAYAGLKTTGSFQYYSVKIPDSVTVGGIKYKVTGIADHAFKYQGGLKSVTISKSVTSIGNEAFMDCQALETVKFANGSKLKSIGNGAFQNCKKLGKLTVPATVTEIGDNAFRSCTSLKTVTFESGSRLTGIGSSAFKNCKKLTKITVPGKTAKIGASAFSSCTSLKTVTLGAGLTTMGKNAFSNCKKLSTITIKSKKLKSVGSNALKGIASTARIKVPKVKLSAYKRLLKGKGQGRNVKIVKI